MRSLQSLWFVLLLLVSGCSVKPDHNTQSFVTAQGRPALWRVTQDGKAGGAGGIVYLFGTVHMLPKGTQWQGPAIEKAARASDRLVIEVTGLNDADMVSKTFAHMGISPNLPPLSQRVSPDLRAGLAQASASAAMPPAMLNSLETWAAALTLSSSSNTDMGLNKSLGADAILLMQFSAEGKPVSGLETLTQQLGFLDMLSETEQRAMLSQIIRDQMQGKQKVRREMQALLTAWLTGDSDALLDSANTGIMASSALRETLLDSRNRRWSNQIAAMIDQGQRPFVAVGAAHLAGAGGVPALLTARGYTVERVQ